MQLLFEITCVTVCVCTFGCVCVRVCCNQGVYCLFQGLMKSSLVPVLPMDWASLSLPPPFFLSLIGSPSFSHLSFPPCPSLSPSLTNSPNYKAQRIWRTGSPKGSCLQNQVCLSVCVWVWLHVSQHVCVWKLVCMYVCIFGGRRHAMISMSSDMCACLSHCLCDCQQLKWEPLLCLLCCHCGF